MFERIRGYLNRGKDKHAGLKEFEWNVEEARSFLSEFVYFYFKQNQADLEYYRLIGNEVTQIHNREVDLSKDEELVEWFIRKLGPNVYFGNYRLSFRAALEDFSDHEQINIPIPFPRCAPFGRIGAKGLTEVDYARVEEDVRGVLGEELRNVIGFDENLTNEFSQMMSFGKKQFPKK
ncbi:MAG TPA: hypothetical protein VF185_01480 [Patescibacteria group bacterium]